jgi:hypothetical protein
MFLDKNIFNIVRRAGNLSDEQTEVILMQYLDLIKEVLLSAVSDQYLETTVKNLNTPDEIMDFANQMPELVKDKATLDKIKEELDEINYDMLQMFKDSANLGDVVYLRIYLASILKKIDKWEKERGVETTKTQENSDNVNPE